MYFFYGNKYCADRFTFVVEASVQLEKTKSFKRQVSTDSDNFVKIFQLVMRAAPQIEAMYCSSTLPIPINGMSRSIPNGLVSACLAAFSTHKRLVLRPDDIFFPLVDAIATHVFQQGEAMRSVFVNSSPEGEKKTLVVFRDEFKPPNGPINENDWLNTLPEFRRELLSIVHPGSVDDGTHILAYTNGNCYRLLIMLKNLYVCMYVC